MEQTHRHTHIHPSLFSRPLDSNCPHSLCTTQILEIKPCSLFIACSTLRTNSCRGSSLDLSELCLLCQRGRLKSSYFSFIFHLVSLLNFSTLLHKGFILLHAAQPVLFTAGYGVYRSEHDCLNAPLEGTDQAGVSASNSIDPSTYEQPRVASSQCQATQPTTSQV